MRRFVPRLAFLVVVVGLLRTAPSRFAEDVLIRFEPNARDLSRLQEAPRVPVSLYRYDNPPRTNGDNTITSLFPGRKLRAVVVRRYLGRWQGEKLVRKIVRLTITGKAGTFSPTIDWAEVSIWSIDALLVFDNQFTTRLVIGGGHVCVVDNQGLPWFTRVHWTSQPL